MLLVTTIIRYRMLATQYHLATQMVRRNTQDTIKHLTLEQYDCIISLYE